MARAGQRFFLQQTNQIEFAAGMCWHPEGQRLLISYGIRDCEAWLGSVEAREVAELLVIESHFDISSGHFGGVRQNGHPREGSEPLPEDNPNVAWFGDDDWVRGQTNRALLDRDAIDWARGALAARDLLHHPDYPKSWDSYLALWHCTRTTDPKARVVANYGHPEPSPLFDDDDWVCSQIGHCTVGPSVRSGWIVLKNLVAGA
jgi:hypothetical protein